ncbi:MAG: hypothetical protein ACOXZ2_01395 [Sphaerochaetaceae bacterium]|jgi:hypothetical protein|nr:hypothetical protein [Spirochaetales bacterium]
MESQEELKEILLDSLKAPEFKINSISIATSNQFCYINLNKMTYTLREGWMDGYIVEDTPIYEGGLGLKYLLQSMATEDDLDK